MPTQRQPTIGMSAETALRNRSPVGTPTTMITPASEPESEPGSETQTEPVTESDRESEPEPEPESLPQNPNPQNNGENDASDDFDLAKECSEAEDRCREDFRKCGRAASQLGAKTLDTVRQLYAEAESIYRQDFEENGENSKRPVLSKLNLSKPGKDCLTSCTDAFEKQGKLTLAQQRALAGHRPYFLATRYYTKKPSFGNHLVRKLANMNCVDLLRIEFKTESSESTTDENVAVRSADENAISPENKAKDSDLPSSKPTLEDIAKLVDSYEHRISGLEKSLDELTRAYTEVLKSHTELKQRQETNNKEIQEASSQQLQCQTHVDALEESVHRLQTDVDGLKARTKIPKNLAGKSQNIPNGAANKTVSQGKKPSVLTSQ